MRTVVVVGILLVGVALAAAVSAQSARLERNTRLTAAIQARIDSQRPVRLSADTMTLTGDTLRLAGRASIRFEDTFILAEAIVIDRAARRVELVGNVNAFVDSALAPDAPARIEFR